MATITGTPGNDKLAGTTLADTMFGLAGNDTYTVNHRGDVVVEANNAGIDTVISTISYVLPTDVENLTLTGTAAINATGNALDNVLIGNTGPNRLVSGDGVDTLKGGAGDDVLVLTSYLTDADRLDGGAGNDTLRLNGDYSAGLTFTATTMIAVERIELATGNDYKLTFNNATNASSLTIDGSLLGAGDDLTIDGSAETSNQLIVIGGAGADTLTGGGGHDWLTGGADADTLTGGLGNDTASYLESAVGVTIDLSLAGAQGGAGDGAGDILSGIENIQGSGADDVLTGTTGANVLDGGAGDDILTAGGGNDNLLGGDGDDTLVLGAGWTTADKIDGGDGLDTLSLEGNYAGGMSVAYSNIERILLGAGFDYKLTLTDAANISGFTVDGSGLGVGDNLIVSGTAEKSAPLTAIGGAGNDSLAGGGGNDILTAGSGTDILLGNAGNDQFKLAGDLTAADKIDGGAGLDQLDLDGDYSAGVILGATTVTNVETITVADGHDYSLTLNNATNSAGLKVDATALSSGNGLTLNGAAETSSSLTALGGAGDDNLTGGGGNDLFIGGAGADKLVGGLGIDTASYADAAAAVTVDLTTPGNNAGEAAGDTLSGIEIILGSNYGDTLAGDATANQLLGGLGDDMLTGGLGNDILLGGSGNDTFAEGATLTALDKFDGGAGTDILSLTASSAYAAGFVFGATTLINTEVIELADGGSYKLTLNNATNTGGLTVDGSALTGGNGLTLIGSAETESALTAIGGAAADILTGGGGNDILEGGAGADKLTGGAGIDTVSYAGSSAGVTVDLARTTAQISSGDASGDILSTIENVRGSDHDDALLGNAQGNVLTGGLGADLLTGGAGVDIADYADSAAGVTVDLRLNGTAQTSAGDANGDRLAADIEGVNGSTFDDTLVGDENANVLIGATGDDNLVSGAGVDMLSGGAGDDILYLDGNLAATDKLDGGDDYDVVSLTANSTYAAGVTFNATTMVNVEEVVLADGGKYRLTLADGNNVDDLKLVINGGLLTGTNSLYVNGSAEKSAGLGVIGGDAADTFIGGNGHDAFEGGAGADTITGGNGNDTVVYWHSSAGVTVNLTLKGAQVSAGEASGDRLITVENLIGSDFADALTGDDKANRLEGGLGDDVLKGGVGEDILIGGGGSDTALYVGSTVGVSIDLSVVGPQGSGGDGAGDILAGIENLVGTNFNDVLQGSDADNTLIGGNGDDFLSGGDGADTFDGGLGNDTVSYADASSGANVTLGGASGGDVLIGIENLIGSSKSDSLNGDQNNNRLEGGSGNDDLSGGGGNDILIGDSGVDTLIAGTGNDILFGGVGNDFLMLGANLTALDKIDGGDGDDDQLFLSANATYASTGIVFSATTLVKTEAINLGDGGSYKLTLNNATNTFGQIVPDDILGYTGGLVVDGKDLSAVYSLILNGAAESESALWAIGGAGDDVLIGGGGNDDLSGGAGADKLTGGAGADFASYGASNVAVTVDLSLKTAQVSTGDASGDILTTIENLRGSAFADVLTGNAGANLLIGGLDADTLNGGNGIDTASYFDSLSGVDVNLVTNVNSGGEAAGDILLNIENIIGSKHGDDLTGDGNNNMLDGGAGDDTLKGGDGNDTLIGGSGFDSLTAGSGNDILKGDDGADTLILADNLTAADKIDGGKGEDELRLSASSAYGTTGVVFGATTLINTETIVLGNGGSYKLTLNNATNSDGLTVDGSALTGANALILNGAAEGESALTALGGDGNDVLTGGSGADLLVGGEGADKLTGGAGIDTASYESSGVAVTVNLLLTTAQVSAGDASGDILTTIENLKGSAFDDILTGNNGANVLTGGAGGDEMDGGAGIDTADYSKAGSAVAVDLTDDAGNNAGDATGDILRNIENVTGSDFHDVIAGDGNSNVLDGGLGNDQLTAGGGNDTLLGDRGDDRLILDDGFTAADRLDGGAGLDQLWLDGNYSLGVTFTATTMVGVEEIVLADGNSYSLTLHDATNSGSLTIGGSTLTGTNRLVVNGSAELSDKLIVFGGNAADLITGGGGQDELSGGNGTDTIGGGDGSDRLSGDAGNDVLDGGAGNDNLNAGTGIDTLTGGDGNDTIEMDSFLTSADRINGGVGEDAVLLKGDYSGGMHLGTATIVNVEAIILADGFDYKLTLNNATNGGKLVVDGSALASNHTVILNGSEETQHSLIAIGGAGDDVLTGGGGNDMLTGGLGADILTGGGGSDTARYAESSAAVTIDLTLITSQVGGGDAIGDILFGIENVIGSIHDDSLTGNSVANVLTGGLGADTLDGGLGADTASYDGSEVGVTIDLGNNMKNAGGDADGDILISIENLTGSAFNDDLKGDANVNVLTGGKGDDVLVALGGNDTLLGGDGADMLTGGTGGDFINGGDGIDTAIYKNATAAITVDLNLTGVQSSGGEAAGDTLIDVENVIATAFKDNLIGNSLNNILEGGAGADNINGGGGSDIASYAGSTVGVTVNLALLTAQISTGDASGDILSNIENLRGSAQADSLTGDSGDNILIGGAGADKLNGSSGVDTAAYTGSSVGVTVSLANLGAQVSAGDASGDVLSHIENLYGSIFDDRLTGDAGINTLWGAEGNDTLSGAAGNDTLNGDEGDDILIGGTGADELDGGEGSDTASYAAAASAVAVNLAFGTQGGVSEASGDRFISIENLIGSKFNDILFGNSGDNVLEGGLGANYINGGGGSDTASYASSSSGVTVDLDFASLHGGLTGGDTLISIENLWGSIHGDTLIGNGGANVLTGGLGADYLDGRDGTDTASYEKSTAVTVDLASDINNAGGEAAGDILDSIENVIGSHFDDHLSGASGDNRLDGGDGDDVLAGATGSDTLIGGAGDDQIFGDDGNDIILGGLGEDALSGGADVDTFVWHSLDEGGDTILDFADGLGNDRLDISDLLVDYADGVSNPLDFVQLVSSGSDTLLQVDVDGAIGGHNFVTLATLTGVSNAIIDDYLTNENLLLS